jgi:RNA polymerase sigma-70 factor (ECF subfamily)
MGEACMQLAAALEGRSTARPRRGRELVGPDREVSDEVLLAGLGSRNPRLALGFVRRFQASVYGLAYAIARDVALAQDIAQQTFEHAWLRADTYDPRRGSVRAWLLRITHNLAVDAVRVHRPTPVDPGELHVLLGQMIRTPEQEVLNAEACASVRAALATLPVEQGRAVIMAVGYGMTVAEIADYEAVPLGTAKYRIRAGLLKLHAALPQPGEGDD